MAFMSGEKRINCSQDKVINFVNNLQPLSFNHSAMKHRERLEEGAINSYCFGCKKEIASSH